MTFTVFGTGAVGAYYGGRLAEHGNTVHFLARSDYETISENGLKIESPRGDIFLKNPSVFNNIQKIPPSDVVIIALKTTGNKNLRNQIAPLVHKGTALLVLQNGLGMEEEFQEWFPENPILGGMCFICSRKKAPGIIEHLEFGLMTLGALNPEQEPLRDEIGKLLQEADVPVTIENNLHEARWRKLLWNIPYNGLTVALDCNTKDIMTNPDSRHLAEVLMGEVVAGAAACGVSIQDEAVSKMLSFTDGMKPYEPSMKVDFNFKRDLEIEYLYDRPLAEAAAKGYLMSSVSMLRDQLKFIQSRY